VTLAQRPMEDSNLRPSVLFSRGCLRLLGARFICQLIRTGWPVRHCQPVWHGNQQAVSEHLSQYSLTEICQFLWRTQQLWPKKYTYSDCQKNEDRHHRNNHFQHFLF
jgi:hypothetical protein